MPLPTQDHPGSSRNQNMESSGSEYAMRESEGLYSTRHCEGNVQVIKNDSSVPPQYRHSRSRQGDEERNRESVNHTSANGEAHRAADSASRTSSEDSIKPTSHLQQQSTRHAENKRDSRSAAYTDQPYPKSKSFSTQYERSYTHQRRYNPRHKIEPSTREQKNVGNTDRDSKKNGLKTAKSDTDTEIMPTKQYAKGLFATLRTPVRYKNNVASNPQGTSSFEYLLKNFEMNKDLSEYFVDLLNTLHSESSEAVPLETASIVSFPSEKAGESASFEQQKSKANQIGERTVKLRKNPLYENVKSKYLEPRTNFSNNAHSDNPRPSTTSERRRLKKLPEREQSQIEMSAAPSHERLERVIKRLSKRSRKSTPRSSRRNATSSVRSVVDTFANRSKKPVNPKRRILTILKKQLYEKENRRSQFFESLKNMGNFEKRIQRENKLASRSKVEPRQKCKLTYKKFITNSRRKLHSIKIT